MNDAPLSRRALLARTGAFGVTVSIPFVAPRAFAQAADWPSRGPIKVIVPGPPGGAMDNLLRIIQPALQQSLNQTVVLDFKPGANSIIGIDAVAKAPADGYTLCIAPSSAIAINPIILPKMPYDAQKDLVPVAQMGAAGILLVANPSTGLKNLQDLVNYAKANPGKLAYASWGNGSTGHLVMEGIKSSYGLFMPHIPYKTTAQEVTDLLANNIGVGFTDIASPVPHIRAGKLVALGATGSSRGPALPNLPTLSEQGFKFDLDGWFGVFAPAATPPAIVARLNQEIGHALANEENRQKFAQQNMSLPAYKNAAQFGGQVKTDIEMWKALGKKANLKMD
ncbi:MAG: tripartite tricarboxylate transporter substrate-binding protein [Variovorax sp.]